MSVSSLVRKSRRSWFRLTEVGPSIEYLPTRPHVALLNSNPFAEGIANLGAQVIAEALLAHEINVDFGFADTTIPRQPLVGGMFAARDSDVLAVSVAFEDTYHHVPRMLRACGVPAWAGERNDRDPIVVGGGMALINPMPLSPFFDAMVMGEGREAIVEIVRTVIEARRRGERRQGVLRALAEIPHVYVPSLYRIEVDADGAVTDFLALDGAPETIPAARPLDMTDHPISSIWTSPRACYKYDDYFSVMVAMGCHMKCPFCVVGNVQGSEDGRALNIGQEQIIELAEARRREYGTRLIKLFYASSFSGKTSIHPLELKNLLAEMLSRGFECRVGSLNIRQADGELLELIRRAGQERVTFAPETSETLRRSVGKAYSKDAKILETAELAGKLGLGLDLYTMVGLPEERPRHARDLANLIDHCRRRLSPGQTLEVSINPAFAKAQTPFERYATLRPEVVRSRFEHLRSCLDTEEGIEWVTVIGDPLCYYQPILALGGEELAPAIDALSEDFWPTEQDWRVAVWEHVGDDRRYFRERGEDEILPWQHIVFNDHDMMSTRLGQFVGLASQA